MKRIIAISGWKKSGKDTAAERLIKNHSFERIAFADPLKVNVADQFGIPLSDTHNQDRKEAPYLNMRVEPKDDFSRLLARFLIKEFRFADGSIPRDHTMVEGQFYGINQKFNMEPVYWTPRALCILEGSTKRTVDSDYWVKQAVLKAADGGSYVIADLRYKSELSGLKMALSPDDKLITVRVNRFETTESTDPSERDLDNAEFDIVINNKESLQAFLNTIDNIATRTAANGV